MLVKCLARSAFLKVYLFLYRTLCTYMYFKSIFYVLYFLKCLPETLPCGLYPCFSTSLSNIGHLSDGFPCVKQPTTSNELDGFLAPVKYHATVLLQKYTIMNTPLNSACVKCGVCLVVSEKLDNILNLALKSSISLKDFNDELSAQLLRPICDFAFHSYGLKEWNGLRVISQYQFLDSVPNSLEGQWWEVLKNACHFYLTHFGEGNFVRAWLLESQNATGLLCRNDGLFRDCLNIEQGILTIQLPQKFLFPKNHVEITYPCA